MLVILLYTSNTPVGFPSSGFLQPAWIVCRVWAESSILRGRFSSSFCISVQSCGNSHHGNPAVQLDGLCGAVLRQEQPKHSSKFSVAMESSAVGWRVRLVLDNVHKGGERKQQKPWGRNPGFNIRALVWGVVIPFAVSSQVGRVCCCCVSVPSVFPSV